MDWTSFVFPRQIQNQKHLGCIPQMGQQGEKQRWRKERDKDNTTT